MLEQILTEIKNWFVMDKYTGTFTVQNGRIALPFLAEGQYFRVIGSVFNDGLHQYPDENMTDETFSGAVWAMAVPKSVIALANEVNDWQVKYGDQGAYQSESFGGYTYTRATGKDGKSLTWKDVFASRLSAWRKL